MSDENLREQLRIWVVRATKNNPEMLEAWDKLPEHPHLIPYFQKLKKEHVEDDILYWIRLEPMVTIEALEFYELVDERPKMPEHREYRKKLKNLRAAIKDLLKRVEEAK